MDAKTKQLLVGLAIAGAVGASVIVLRSGTPSPTASLLPSGYPQVLGTSGADQFAQNYYQPDIPNYLGDPNSYLTFNMPEWPGQSFGDTTYYGAGNSYVGGTNIFSFNQPIDLSQHGNGACGDCCCDGCDDTSNGSLIITMNPKAAQEIGKAQGGYMDMRYGTWLTRNMIG